MTDPKPPIVLYVEPNDDPILTCMLCGRETTTPPELCTRYLTTGGSAIAGIHRRCYERAAERDCSASDAIARRRAIEECIAMCDSVSGDPTVGPYTGAMHCATRIKRALLRAPTSEKAEGTRPRMVDLRARCGGRRLLPSLSGGPDVRCGGCADCSPPADGGGDG